MRGALRSLLLVGLLAAACTGASPPPLSAQERPLEIHATALPFKSDEPAATTVGQLRWRGGIAMTANSRRFGGWSDLHISPDSHRLASISDEGSWLVATIDYDADESASEKLDEFVRAAQRVLDSYGGNVLQLTLGDKGAYLYGVFGTPLAHEDDAARACSAA